MKTIRCAFMFLLSVVMIFTGCSSPADIETVAVTEPSTSVTEPIVLTENQLGQMDGWDYELWKDYGNTEMILDGGSAFTCRWSDINNALFSYR